MYVLQMNHIVGSSNKPPNMCSSNPPNSCSLNVTFVYSSNPLIVCRSVETMCVEGFKGGIEASMRGVIALCMLA